MTFILKVVKFQDYYYCLMSCFSLKALQKIIISMFSITYKWVESSAANGSYEEAYLYNLFYISFNCQIKWHQLQKTWNGKCFYLRYACMIIWRNPEIAFKFLWIQRWISLKNTKLLFNNTCVIQLDKYNQHILHQIEAILNSSKRILDKFSTQHKRFWQYENKGLMLWPLEYEIDTQIIKTTVDDVKVFKGASLG